MSNDKWNFKSKDKLIYIENISKAKFLGTRNNVDAKVILEDEAKQLWKKGEPNDQGYFTLEHSEKPLVITAISSSGLEINGNITLR